MRSPSSWPRVLRLTYAATLPLYFACGTHPNPNPSLNPITLALTLTLIIALALTLALTRCGMLGYAAYGDFAKANINVNFPDNLANQASIAVQMVQEVRDIGRYREIRGDIGRYGEIWRMALTLSSKGPKPKPNPDPRSTFYSRPTSSSCSPSSCASASTQVRLG